MDLPPALMIVVKGGGIEKSYGILGLVLTFVAGWSKSCYNDVAKVFLDKIVFDRRCQTLGIK